MIQWKRQVNFSNSNQKEKTAKRAKKIQQTQILFSKTHLMDLICKDPIHINIPVHNDSHPIKWHKTQMRKQPKKDQISSRNNQNVEKKWSLQKTQQGKENQSPYLKVYAEVRILSWNFPEKVMRNCGKVR